MRKEIREMVTFAPQNLIMDPPFTRLDILSCRNLLIYLTAEVQKKLMRLFHYSLNPGGILFLGSAETVGGGTGLFAPLNARARIFRRTETALTPEPVEFPSSFNALPADRPEAHATSVPPASLQSVADRHKLTSENARGLVEQLESLPGKINVALELNDKIAKLAERFVNKQHMLYLGRGSMYPVAMEGALKLKEISYIHAEAYPAGELKHGPLALVDENMPVLAVAPNNELLEKLKSNLEEVRARGGELYIFADSTVNVGKNPGIHVLDVAPVEDPIAPIVYTIPLQLFAYHVAVLKGADVDQPRNLAKSVTVE
jgi:hypothetical protein